MAKKAKRNKIGLQCTVTKEIDYVLYYNEKPGAPSKKLELMKFSKKAHKHTLHKAVKIK